MRCLLTKLQFPGVLLTEADFESTGFGVLLTQESREERFG